MDTKELDTKELVLTGCDLSLLQLAAAARDPSIRVSVAASSIDKMQRNREFVESIAERGTEVYGLTTGVGMRKKRRITTSEMIEFNNRMVRDHATGQGPHFTADITRGAAILLLNALANGRSQVRPEVAIHISKRLTDGPPLTPIPRYGSTGVGDVTPLAHLTFDLLGDFGLAPGEALPLIAQSSFVTAQAALAVHDLSKLLHTLNVLAVLDIEAYDATPDPYHAAVGEVRPYPGHQQALRTINRLLHGSGILTRPRRHLQSPLSFRGAATVLGSAFEALSYCEQQVQREMTFHQLNPLPWPDEDRMIPTANFDMQILATTMDFARLALAPCITSQNERSIKLLQSSETGLTDGLEPRGDSMGHGLSEIVWPLQAMAMEARLLTQPVSSEVGSSTQAEGIEDRHTMAGLGARKLVDMIDLTYRCAAISAVISCQAIDLRRQMDEGKAGPNGSSTAVSGGDMNRERDFHVSNTIDTLHQMVRALIPMMQVGDPPPSTLEPLVEALKQGLFLV